MRKFIKLIAILACLALVFAGCSGGDAEAENLNDYTLEEIIAKAQEEGDVQSVGMPDTWANWGLSWEGLEAEYGITHEDADMSSAEELNTFANDDTKDIGDIGLAFTGQAVEEDLVQSYKTSYWESVPDWAKHPDGLWMIAYTGCTAFVYNNDACEGPIPTTWKEVREGTYKLTIGDVVGGGTGQGVVVATAYAFGGDLNNLEPAYEFWTEMAKAGRIDPGDIVPARIEAGEVELGVTWSYNAPGYKEGASHINITLGIPDDGAILVGYASVINKNSDTPFAAALAREYIFSDAGQINLAKAGAVPTRTDVEIPQEVIEATFDPSEFATAIEITDGVAYSDACKEISNWWNENIIPLLNA